MSSSGGSHGFSRRVLLVIIGVVIFAAAGWALWKGDIFFVENPLGRAVDVFYLLPLPDQTTAWYEYQNGSLKQYPPLSRGEVTAMARSDDSTYLSITSPANSTEVFRYTDGVYTSLYRDVGQRWTNIAISPGGGFIAFKGSTHTGVLNIASGEVTKLGPPTIAPQLIQGEVPAVLYADGTKLLIRVREGGAWGEPQTVFESTGATIGIFASDRKDRIAIVDPVQRTIETRRVTSLAPLSLITETTLSPQPGYTLAYAGGELYGYTYALTETGPNFAHLTVRALSSGKTYTFTPPRNLGPLARVFLFEAL